MGFNLALILTLLTVVSGVVLLINRFVWKEPVQAEGKPGSRRLLWAAASRHGDEDRRYGLSRAR